MKEWREKRARERDARRTLRRQQVLGRTHAGITRFVTSDLGQNGNQKHDPRQIVYLTLTLVVLVMVLEAFAHWGL